MTIVMKMFGNKNFKDNVLITGFHGIGTTGFIAVKYIVNELNAQKIGTIISNNQPPFITTKNGKISLPFEFFQVDEKVLLVPQFQPYRNEHREFAEQLVNWTVQCSFNKSILIGGLDSRLRKNNNEKLRVIATTAYLEKNKTNLPILEDGLFVAGPIALLLTYYEIQNFPAIALLPFAESSRTDPLAASAAIEVINDILGLKLNTNKLIHDAEQIEQNLQDIITQTKEPEMDKGQGNRSLYI